uniref:Uncharacterized protein n=1 Tax=Cannabis sativa TaxID=3483 RepID=A0A803NU22_CANSA
MFFLSMDSPQNFDSVFNNMNYKKEVASVNSTTLYSAKVSVVHPWNISSEPDFIKLTEGDHFLMELPNPSSSSSQSSPTTPDPSSGQPTPPQTQTQTSPPPPQDSNLVPPPPNAKPVSQSPPPPSPDLTQSPPSQSPPQVAV